MTRWHNLSIEETLKQLDPSPDGLSDPEAQVRLNRWGSNQLETRKSSSWFVLLLKQFANYFILVLLFAAGLAYAVSYLPGQGDRKLTARGIVYSPAQYIWRHPPGPASMGGDASGCSRFILFWCLHDPLDLEVGAVVG